MMEPSFEKPLVLLAEAGVRFVVVGGLAVTLHGYVRLTEDIDLLLEDSPANLTSLLETLGGFGEGFARELDLSDFTPAEGAIRIVEETEQSQLDLFTRMSGLSYRDIHPTASTVTVAGHEIPFASKKALIGWKEKSVREKDRIDALALRRLLDDPDAFR